MYLFKAANSNDMAKQVYNVLQKKGIQRDSRNGRVLMLPLPATMIYTDPLYRCNFTVNRKANPVFHHMEAMWMLAGRNDVKFLEIFNTNMKTYSDDGVIFNAAYGHRIRKHFGHDQLKECIGILASEPDSRQAVIQLWDHNDLMKDTKDKACNMLMVFSINFEEQVDLLIFNRSNDAVYGGVTGANPVHFSYFLQYVAERLALDVGHMTFVSNNLHVYLDLYNHWRTMIWDTVISIPIRMVYKIGELEEIELFCNLACAREYISEEGWESRTLTFVTVPMYNYWIATKYKEDSGIAQHWINKIISPEWAMAVSLWESKYEIA